MTFLVSFGLSKYASFGLIAAVNVVLSAIGIAAVSAGIAVYVIGDTLMLFSAFYICIPNIIMYLMLRRGRKEKYNFEVHLLKALIMAVIWFPFSYLALASLIVLY